MHCEKQRGIGIISPSIVYFFLFTVAVSFALEVPPLRGRVNDYANLMPPARGQALEQRLEEFENQTGHQLAVLTIPSLQGEDIEGFGIRVAENWKIGKKKFDNGAILIISKDDRKLRIEVGYGLEGVLPDAIANRIIQDIIVPRFRNGDFPGGIEAGVDAMMKGTSGEPLPETARKRKSAAGSYVPLIIPLLFFGILILSMMGRGQQMNGWSSRGRRRYYGPGGFFPGGFGGGGFGGSGGGGFSGGGGGFGGGGASGSW
ncbi:MAG TPA: YgcG family protein [Candidatus Binatia bacterium]